ncbi:hypothetical protein [Sulfurisphaera ohwakuensis]|uniref:Uncharacterized protein n=1 Tax=Sulfurisphaera ohwakuensis TaxID=69656 RepID=A0A7J9RRF2_SULOH|nr:hypothetical protein [Sulfurisphaera ohwakuensis]MBB5253538.1 hypothetical protein [Sulfurisphaera ohwakuensis]
MEFVSLFVFVSGIIVALLTLYFSPDFGRVKPNKRNLSTIFLSLALAGIGLWLYYIDRPTYIAKPIKPILPPGNFDTYFGLYGPQVEYIRIPPPWYANLWSETLTSGVILLALVVFLHFRPRK